MMKSLQILWVLLLSAAFPCLSGSGSGAEPPTGKGEAASKIPVIYSTDLYHPHVDADDHFDMVTLLAIDEIDVKAVVLDNAGPSQEERPGSIPLRQLFAITGKNIPFAVGLRSPLASPDDKALNQERKYQAGVDAIIDALRGSRDRVAIVAVGSLRDVAAAFNREPELLREKSREVLVFIGDASEEHSIEEYNVGLDKNAFIRVFQSGLNLLWVPCFDGGHPKNLGHASCWIAGRGALLEDCQDSVLQYFIYCFKKPEADPLEFLKSPVKEEDRKWLFSDRKELFCTVIFTCLTDRRTYFDGKRYLALDPGKAGKLEERKIFRFSPVDVTVTAGGTIKYGASPTSRRVLRFEIADKEAYGEAMTSMTAALLSSLGAGRRSR